MTEEREESTLEYESRQRLSAILPLLEREVVALESLAESLEIIAGCVGRGYYTISGEDEG